MGGGRDLWLDSRRLPKLVGENYKKKALKISDMRIVAALISRHGIAGMATLGPSQLALATLALIKCLLLSPAGTVLVHHWYLAGARWKRAAAETLPIRQGYHAGTLPVVSSWLVVGTFTRKFTLQMGRLEYPIGNLSFACACWLGDDGLPHVYYEQRAGRMSVMTDLKKLTAPRGILNLTLGKAQESFEPILKHLKIFQEDAENLTLLEQNHSYLDHSSWRSDSIT
uniref:Uncharacterized protein n=1 Tax=Timema poppense TaxID=170557 RepID=A0A7R9CX07_TIMPO|nr:unnamed protein product [Timema poppensis]